MAFVVLVLGITSVIAVPFAPLDLLSLRSQQKKMIPNGFPQKAE
jgi:hypothetical protein